MDLFKRLLDRRKEPRRPIAALDALIEGFDGLIPDLLDVHPEQELLRARLADACRDAQVEPVGVKEFDDHWDAMDLEDRRRMVLFIGALEGTEFREAWKAIVARDKSTEAPFRELAAMSADLSLLSIEILDQSELRREEFARHLLARLGIDVAGETDQASVARLYELDYARLLAEAERARLSAEDRLEYLRKLQEEADEKRGPRRGKN